MFSRAHPLLIPILVIVSFPLFLLACLTITLALSALLIRVLFVYLELFLVLSHNQVLALTTASSTSAQKTPNAPASAEPTTSRRHRRKSSTGSGSMTPKASGAAGDGTTTGFSLLGGGGIDRDFEGVGGWRLPDENEDDAVWLSMNKRLELPATVVGDRKKKHKRSLTSGSLSFVTSPTLARSPGPPSSLRSPVQSLARMELPTLNAGGIGQVVGSPEGYFSVQTVQQQQIGANVGKAMVYKRNSSSSSSGKSGQGLQMMMAKE